MLLIVFTMIFIVATMILIVLAKIGTVLKHLKYVWVNCFIIANYRASLYSLSPHPLLPQAIFSRKVS